MGRNSRFTKKVKEFYSQVDYKMRGVEKVGVCRAGHPQYADVVRLDP